MPKASPLSTADVPMSRNIQLIDYLLLMRFGPRHTQDFNKPLLNLTSISKLTHLSVKTVSSLIRQGVTARRNKDFSQAIEVQ